MAMLLEAVRSRRIDRLSLGARSWRLEQGQSSLTRASQGYPPARNLFGKCRGSWVSASGRYLDKSGKYGRYTQPMASAKGRKRVSNQQDLARELGCVYITLKKWLTDERYSEERPIKEPNGTYIVEKYVPWMEFHGLSGKSGGEPEVSRSQKLRDDLAELKIERERVKIDKERGVLIERSLVPELMGKTFSLLYRTLDRKLCNDSPPKLAGRTERQIQKILKDTLRSGFEEAKRDFEEQFEEIE